MASIKCSTCGAMCNNSLSTCDVCGNPLVGQAPSGFGQTPQTQSGFGQPPSGFGQTPQPQSGFGQPSEPVQGGFGQPPAQGFGQPSQSFGQAQPAQGFGEPAQGGFGQAPAQGGFGQPPAQGFGGPPKVETSGFEAPTGGFPAAPSFDAVPKQGFQGAPSDSARFAETVSKQGNADESVYWNFKQCLMFSLKCLIPFYGIVLIVMCALGNPRKYPTVITNYVRASLITSAIIMVVTIILTLVLGAGAFSLL